MQHDVLIIVILNIFEECCIVRFYRKVNFLRNILFTITERMKEVVNIFRRCWKVTVVIDAICVGQIFCFPYISKLFDVLTEISPRPA